MLTVKELRLKTGLTQSQFAKYIEVPLSTLQHWEQGHRTPPNYVVHLIERVLLAEQRRM